ncbi:MAG: sel1 repeat family protein, partial [Tagaea sp.]|nr:sel1 repeat family protein [Tagaea sp.]
MRGLRLILAGVLAAALAACAPDQANRPVTAAPAEPALRSTPEGEALVRLAYMHRRGDGVPRNASESVRLLMEAMGKGEPAAYVEMGLLTAEGISGVPKDEPAAIRLFERAWSARLPAAAYWLGSSHYVGRGVEKDMARAREWFGRAAELGEPRAQFGMGLMSERGEGAPVDLAAAIDWYR